MPEELFQSGRAEIKNWLPVAAVGRRRLDLERGRSGNDGEGHPAAAVRGSGLRILGTSKTGEKGERTGYPKSLLRISWRSIME